MKAQLRLFSFILFSLFMNTSIGQAVDDYEILIIQGGTATHLEVETQLEALGHNITPVPNSSVTAGYDFSPYDVAIFMWDTPMTFGGYDDLITENEDCNIGIISMSHSDGMDSIFVGNGNDWTSGTFEVYDNSHWITEIWSTGTLPLDFTYKVKLFDIPSDATVLGLCGTDTSLVVHDVYRRVACPYYGHTSGMPWNADADTLMDRIVSWAAYGCCTETTSSIDDSACYSYTSPSGFYEWTVSGVYNDTIPNAGGCDSIITVSLTIDTTNTDVTVTDNVIISAVSGGTYQWINCSDTSEISGATDQSYEPSTNGDYAVIVTTPEGCTDTSNCVTISDIGVETTEKQDLQLDVFPNPSNGTFKIRTNVQSAATIFLYDLTGKKILELKMESNMLSIETDLEKGNYFLKYSSGDFLITKRVVIK